jgi:hypothetical protein
MSRVGLFILINLIGGIFVLGGYFLGITSDPSMKIKLWGNLPESWQGFYFASIIMSSIGYLVFFYNITFKQTAGYILTNRLILLCVIFLFSASLWMPLTIKVLENNNNFFWILSQISLWVTAFAAITITILLIRSPHRPKNRSYQLTMWGMSYLSFHCLVLDAILWTNYFY